MPSFPIATYPQAEDVSSLLSIDAGLAVSAADLEPYLQEAIDEWHEITRYRPFLQTSDADVTFYFNPPGQNMVGESRGGGRILLLDRGFLSITSVTTMITPTSTGQALTADTDYRTQPFNASTDSKPITSIEFTYPVWGMPRSVKVVGLPGFAATIKAEVWQAIRKDAAARYLKSVLEGIYASPTEVHSADEGMRQDSFRDLGNSWLGQAKVVRARYTLLTGPNS